MSPVDVPLPPYPKQDFFDKVNECMKRMSTRLAVLRLLAYVLNSQVSRLTL